MLDASLDVNLVINQILIRTSVLSPTITTVEVLLCHRLVEGARVMI